MIAMRLLMKPVSVEAGLSHGNRPARPDGDGRIDEGDERGLPFVYPGPDGDESQDNCLGLEPEHPLNRNFVATYGDDSDGDGYTDSEDLCPALATKIRMTLMEFGRGPW